MSKYIQLSRYYFNDKDMADVLSGPEFSDRRLLSLARGRGFFFSPNEGKQSLVKRLSRIPLDWDGLRYLAERLNSDEREKKRSTRRLENFKDLDAVGTAFSQLRDERGGKRSEVYKLQKSSENKYEAQISYVVIDSSKARAFQRTEAIATIELEVMGDNIEARFSHDDRSREIVLALFEKLRAAVDKPLETVDIELTGIRDPLLRTQFFLNLKAKVRNFRTVDVVDLAFDRRLPDLKVPATPSDKESQEKPVEATGESTDGESGEQGEIKSLVRRAVFSGQGLLTSELALKLRETGYYIAKIRWLAKETMGESRVVEFESGFEDPPYARGFFYEIKKVFPRDDEADKKRTAAELLRLDRSRLRNLLSEASYLALAELKNEIDGRSKPPIVEPETG